MNLYFNCLPRTGLISGILLSSLLINSPSAVLAGPGHGNEFQDKSGANVETTDITIDPKTAGELRIKTLLVQRQRLGSGIRSTGQIEALPDRQVEVTNPVSGKITELLVKPGDAVKSGQPVAVMSSLELIESRVKAQEQRTIADSELKQALADLKLARENYTRTRNIIKVAGISSDTRLTSLDTSLFQSDSVLAVAKDNYDRQKQISSSEIESAKIELSVAKEQYERDSELAERGAIPKRQMRESQAKYAAARAKLTGALGRPDLLQAESALKQAELDFRKELASAQNEVNRALASVEAAREKVRLSDTAYKTRLAQLQTGADSQGRITILAPISGRVADREATLGQSFQDAGGRLMTIVNDDRLLVSANIYEKDLGRVKIGQVVRVKVNGIPERTFSGTIGVIGSTVQGESRIIPVKAEIQNPRGLLKPGMFANLEILTGDNSSEVMAIPQEAIVEANNKNLVYVRNGNSYKAVEVTIGETYGDLVEVRTGLFTGDEVVIQRAPQLYAQALKGGGSDNHGDEHASGEKNQTPSERASFSPWFLVPIGGFLAGGMFWLGSVYGNRRRDSEIKGTNNDSTFDSRPSESLENSEKL